MYQKTLPASSSSGLERKERQLSKGARLFVEKQLDQELEPELCV